MSSKSKRFSQAAGKTPTPTVSSSGRPASPTMISRMAEKDQLASLNDRLAAYIECVRSLEIENERLTKIISSHEEIGAGESSKIKALYDEELRDARNLLDQMGKEKAKIQLELNKVKSEYDELLSKYIDMEKALDRSNNRVLSLENQLSNAQVRLSDATSSKKHLEDNLARVKKDLDLKNKQLELAKNQLEEETIRRVDLENKMQSLKEQLSFQKEVHLEELNSPHRKRLQVTEIEERRDYESEMADALKQMREESEQHIANSRAELEEVFHKKLRDLQNDSGHWQGEARKSQTELMQLKSRIESLTADLNKLNAKLEGNESRVEMLERRLQDEKDAHASTASVKEAEIRRLKQQLEEQLQEYRDLFDLKIKLDIEISTYRKLLDMEESRLNSTQGKEPKGKKMRLGESVETSFTESFTEISSLPRKSASKRRAY